MGADSERNRLDALQERLQVLEDKDALRALLVRGWRALDHKDWDTWSACWAEDAELAFGPWKAHRGRRTIRDTVIAAEAPYGAITHHLLNTHFEVRGDRATGVGHLWFVGVPNADEPGEHYDFGGRYEWEFVRSSAGWRLTRQRLGVTWSSGHDTVGAFR
ncbi:nuclear transport factor 2 family protein [Actinosynnema sp. CS-041913]|uniref:nuclear transport factor 2 family protein n=1 Tax=Actinosynnema sp. CS-041913 TaxID=3239917 RepID=UPI003D940A86